jgi:hypothetical protein
MADQDSDAVLEVDSPQSLLPDLAAIGIEEVEPGVCLDTAENRRKIRHSQHSYRDVYNTDGTPTNFIQVISREMEDARNDNAIDKRRAILSKPHDPDSDYITGTNLLLEYAADTLVPIWVIAATRHWVDVEDRREQTGKMYRPALISAPGRCVARKNNGARCMNWHNGTNTDGQMCRLHLGRHGVTTINAPAKARNRLESATIIAVDELEKLLQTATSEQVKLNTIKEILDRGGVRGGVEIDHKGEIEVRPAGDLVRDRLKRLAARKTEEPAEIEAEIVEDDE